MIKKVLDTLRSKCKCLCFIQCCVTIPEDQFDNFSQRASDINNQTSSGSSSIRSHSHTQYTVSHPSTPQPSTPTPLITEHQIDDYFSFIPNHHQHHADDADAKTPLLQRQRNLEYTPQNRRGTHGDHHQPPLSHNP